MIIISKYHSMYVSWYLQKENVFEEVFVNTELQNKTISRASVN